MARDILIVGGGVIGLCTAYYCARRGDRVTVLERNSEQRDGCSFGNAGMVVPSHFIPLAAPGMVALGLKWMWNPESPFYIQPRLDWKLLSWGWKFWRCSTLEHVARSAPLLRDLSVASRAGFEELAALPGNDFGLVKQGLLVLCRSQHALDEESMTAQRALTLNVPAQILNAHQTASMDPGVRMDVAGSVYFPLDCHLSPHRFLAGLQRQLEALGTRFLWNTRVMDWRVSKRRIEAVVTNQGDVSADEYVLCGGAWSSESAATLGLSLPMQAGKGYSLTLARPRQLPRICAIFSEARVAVTPMGSSLRFGGTMELSGMNEDINPVRVQGILKSVPKYYPDFAPEDFEDVQPWRGLRPCSPDGMPYFGRFKNYENLSTATGHAMMGLSLGPVTGRLMAQLLAGEPLDINVNLLSPDRFG
ncbi:MAG: FAD-dependent oxidoreductase [Pedosphaera sp.]|nr:FAD-dependent oxidoreductase [Pedosphaera sp.]